MKVKNLIKWCAILVVITGLISCATAPSTGGSGQAATGGKAAQASPEPTDSPMYYGSGSGSSQTAAMNSAKINAVRKAVQDAVGIPTALAKQDQIASLFPEDANANSFVFNSSTEILDRASSDDGATVTLGVRINLDAISNLLRANDIYGNQVLPQGGEVKLVDQQPPAALAKAETEQSGAEEGAQAEGQAGSTVASAEPS